MLCKRHSSKPIDVEKKVAHLDDADGVGDSVRDRGGHEADHLPKTESSVCVCVCVSVCVCVRARACVLKCV